MCVSAWTMQFIKHVLPRFIRPRRPERKDSNSGELTRELTDRCFDPDVPEAMWEMCF